MPKPRTDETQEQFISRCIPIVLADGTADSQDQAVAVCVSMWEQAQENDKRMRSAPGYRESGSPRVGCTSCLYAGAEQYCELYDFDFTQGWVCDSWLPLPAKRGGTMEHEYKTVDGMITEVNEDQGRVTAIFAVMGNIDEGQDRIFNGAFIKTFSERGGKVLVLDQHLTDSILRTIAKPLSFRELSREQLPPEILMRYPDATGGAEIVAQFDLEDENSRRAFRRIKNKWINQWSFGYDALDYDMSKELVDGKEIVVRNLRTLKLYEVSPVLWGMNSATLTTDAKGASGKTDLPIADRERAWDSEAAISRVRGATGSEDEPSRTYRNAFFWFDSESADEYGAYKLPFADVVNGRLTAIPRAIFASAAAIQGARGGVNIPEGDRDAVRSRIARYYTRMRRQFDDEGIVPPWEKAALGGGQIKYVIENSDGFKAEFIASREIPHSEFQRLYKGEIGFLNLLEEYTEIKTGRAISKTNEDRIRARAADIVDAVNDLLDMLNTVLGSTAETPPDDERAGDGEDDQGKSEAGPTESPTSIAQRRQELLDEIEQLMEV